MYSPYYTYEMKVGVLYFIFVRWDILLSPCSVIYLHQAFFCLQLPWSQQAKNSQDRYGEAINTIIIVSSINIVQTPLQCVHCASNINLSNHDMSHILTCCWAFFSWKVEWQSMFVWIGSTYIQQYLSDRTLKQIKCCLTHLKVLT